MAHTQKATTDYDISDIILTPSEVRKFKMHPDLLFSVIKSQAGTQEKAILEAVMNAVDAGATRCDITIDQNGYYISDDGKGFSSRQEVDEFFETFGTPHKEGDATYGRFRMGRGQLFAFSSTIWKTTTFEMHVDIKKTGLDYVFKENMDNVNGCTIIGTWYKPMATQEIFVMTKELQNLIKYMQIPVFVNGKDFSVDPEKQKWDYKEDDFYVKVNKNSNTLSVYNMGALVSHYPASRFGVAGTVVTKSALKVNFARNDVLTSECVLWKKITKKMRDIMGIETSKKNILTDAEREAILDSVICHDTLLGEVIQKGLLVDISGKKISFHSLIHASRITFSTGISKLKKVEERISDSKMALVLTDINLQKFYVDSPENFVTAINDLITFNNTEVAEMAAPYHEDKDWRKYHEINQLKIYGSFKPTIIDITELIDGISTLSENIEEKKLNKKQTIFLKAVRDISGWIGRIVYASMTDRANYSWNDSKKFERSICLGVSEVASAWTDGKSYIAIEHRHISSHPMKIIHMLIHEYCHNSVTLESHDHGHDFYELYHNVLIKYSKEIFDASIRFQKVFNKIMLKEGVKPKKIYDDNVQLDEDYQSVKDHDFEQQPQI